MRAKFQENFFNEKKTHFCLQSLMITSDIMLPSYLPISHRLTITN